MREGPAKYLFTSAALAAVYFVAGKAGLSLAVVNESATAVWPPTGIAIAALLLLGSRFWPAIAAGAFLVNLTTSGVWAASAAIAVGNTLEGVVAAWLVNRYARGAAALDRPVDIVRFTLYAAMGATTIAASVGVGTLLAVGLAGREDAGSIWLTWWLGDAVGTMLVAPLLLVWSRPSTLRWTGGLKVEAVALFGCLLVVSLGVFGTSLAGSPRYPLQLLQVPVLLWAAFRFGARETATAAAVMSVVAIQGTLRGYGPFALASPNESLLLLQSYVGVTTIVMLVVAAEVANRHAAEAKLRALNDALERHVASRTEELTRTQAHLLEAQQVAHVGSWEWDVPANRIWWSDELYRIFGLEPRDTLTYEMYLERVHPDDRALSDTTVREAMRSGRPFTFDHRIVRPDGTLRVSHSEGRVVIGADGKVLRLMGIGHDITERKAAEEERAQLAREHHARREAEEANRIKDRFLAVLSHELRTPLNAALGWAQMLRELPPTDARLPRGIDAIHRNLTVQTRLVSDIMDVSRISIGGLRLERRAVSAAAILEAALETVRDAAAARGITLETHFEAGAVELFGDASRLQQVVWNLLSNAVRFTTEGGHVRVALEHAGDAVTIVVSDDGPGIDPAFLPHVFDQFRQADDSMTREHGGLGLGLAIAQHIVELHGGTIAAANGPDGGAIFTVRLPVAATARG